MNSTHNLYFKQLVALNREEVCERASCRYDEETKSYILSIWGEEFAIDPHNATLDPASNDFPGLQEYMILFCLYYLLNAKAVDISNKWISEKDIPGGATFFRGPHEIPCHLLSRRFENDITAFKRECARLHGAPIDMADAAFRFDITPRIPVAVLYWLGDDDFPPEAKLLYDKTITTHLAPDIVYALAVEICRRIGSPNG